MVSPFGAAPPWQSNAGMLAATFSLTCGGCNAQTICGIHFHSTICGTFHSYSQFRGASRGDGGHMMVAQIAYERLNGTAKAQADKLLAVLTKPVATTQKSPDFVNAAHWGRCEGRSTVL